MSRNPSSWDQYDRGRLSRTSSAQFGRDTPLGRSVDSNHDDDEWTQQLRRRRPSITNRLAALTDIGGVNSIRSFTRSWQRAAGFPEVIPQRPSFVFAPDQAPHASPHAAVRGDVEAAAPATAEAAAAAAAAAATTTTTTTTTTPTSAAKGQASTPAGPGAGSPSLIRQQLEAALQVSGAGRFSPRTQSPDRTAAYARDALHEGKPLLEGPGGGGGLNEHLQAAFRIGSYGTGSGADSIFAIPPHLATPSIVGSYGSVAAEFYDYGSFRSDDARSGRGSMAQLWRQQQQQQQEEEEEEEQQEAAIAESILGGAAPPAAIVGPDDELAPILVKEVEQDGKIVLAVEGQSTLPQTVFNSTNVLIGVGLLSLPMGFKYAGWLCGMLFLFLAAAVTAWTAKILARCMDLDPSLITFSDLAFISFGRNARIATSVLFTLELLAANVALIVLFADSLDLLLPGVLSVNGWKVFCAVLLMPLNFLPLRLLSFTSVIGIFSCLSIALILVLDGLIKPTSPGSLIEPAKTHMFPTNWLTLPLSFGLLMSPWGGHGVFPNIYRDMRHPYKYAQAVKITFSFTYLLDTTTAVVGFLMFGDDVRDEITSNILLEASYPRALTLLMCMCIAIIPLTKIPLNARPIVSTIEVLLGLNDAHFHHHHHHHHDDDPYYSYQGPSAAQQRLRSLAKVAIRIVVVLVFLAIAIIFPEFDSIMAFMGSALCFTICVTLPLAFYLKLFGHELSVRERAFALFVMTVSSALSIVGTIWAFLPKSLIGAE
ncbi:hypothetical protein VTJ83DRAFT_1069 [Remersonia thermophila]|uniref:Amino acid transporter transmembrane domain-containing protein n=1 Tax=Remersonia thermophila TaxID=72144 RepID=A0ABR4DN54_9PEZI